MPKKYKLWDIYKWDVSKLKRYSWRIEKYDETNLFVNVTGNYFPSWTICKLESNDDSTTPLWTDWDDEYYVNTSNFAKLNNTMSDTPTKTTHKYTTMYERDDGVVFKKDCITGFDNDNHSSDDEIEIEELREEVETKRWEIEELEKLLSAHARLFPKKKK